ncbi:hypothetical protein Noda2021_00770 [Candidatus Dependentiae bacterium Noda2021]|nr:hypothetical protein Noda2021_00770 [Candidatus Dependentiae bacterium Noda2021]
MKKILSLLIIICPSLYTMEPQEQHHNLVILDQPHMVLLKDGLNEMVASGKKLDDWNHNKAVTTYITFQEQFNACTELNYKHLVNQDDRKNVDTLWRRVKDAEEFTNAIEDALEKQTPESWKQFRKVMATLAMKAMKEKGVAFQPHPSKDTHADFLKANHDISDEAAQWLFPGSVLLFYAQEIQDIHSSKQVNYNVD